MTRMDEAIQKRNRRAVVSLIAFGLMVGLITTFLMSSPHYPKQAFGGGGGDAINLSSKPIANPFWDGLVAWFIDKGLEYGWKKANEPCTTQTCRDGMYGPGGQPQTGPDPQGAGGGLGGGGGDGF